MQRFREKKRETEEAQQAQRAQEAGQDEPDDVEEIIRSTSDFGRHSQSPGIDLYPGILPNMAASMMAAHAYPYGGVTEELRNMDDSIRSGVFMLGSLYFGELTRDIKMIGWSQFAYK